MANGFWFLNRKRRERWTGKPLEPDEIFLDSKNLPGFDQGQFEGRLEKALNPKTFWYAGATIFLILLTLWYKAFDTQILNSSIFTRRAEANRLRSVPLWPERGLILDRFGEILADNEPAFRLILETDFLETDSIPDTLEKLEEELSLKTKIHLGNLRELVMKAKTQKQNVILGVFYDWEDLENLRREYIDLPLRVQAFSSRNYHNSDSAAHLLGYIGYPATEDLQLEGRKNWQTFLGISGIEEEYDNELRGIVGSKLTEVAASGEIFSESVESLPQNGKTVSLFIDSKLQNQVYRSIKDMVETRGFKGGAGVVLDVETGEILSIASYPSFNSNILSRGEPREEIFKILNDEQSPLFNRAISGLYPAGSVFKPLLAIAALEEKLISPDKQILSTGNISVPNPYNPDEPSVFYDWKAHGWVDMRHALAVSSNVYFYSIGGGFGEIEGLGVKKIQEYAKLFGLGEKTGIDLPEEKEGIVPGPEWKEKYVKSDPVWRLGDTYNLSIGQGNLQTTPLQMAVFTAAIANGGKILTPKIINTIGESEENRNNTPNIKRILDISEENIQIVREGMKLATEIGTAQSLSGLGVKAAGKTGTAEIGSGKKVNSWLIAFLPYDKPKIAMAIVLEGGSASNLIGASAVSRQIVEWLTIYRPELLSLE